MLLGSGSPKTEIHWSECQVHSAPLCQQKQVQASPQESHWPAALRDSPLPGLVNYKLSKMGHQMYKRTKPLQRVGRHNSNRIRQPRTSDLKLQDMEYKRLQNVQWKRDGKSTGNKRPPKTTGASGKQGGRGHRFG